MNNLKPGFVTSEFLTTMVSQILTALIVMGVIQPIPAQSELAEAIATIILGLLSLFTAVAYIRGRTELKKQQMAQQVVPQMTITDHANLVPVEQPTVIEKLTVDSRKGN